MANNKNQITIATTSLPSELNINQPINELNLNQGTINNNCNTSLIFSVVQTNKGLLKPVQYKYSSSCFNLFVVENDEQFNDGSFEVTKDSSLTKYIDENIKNKYIGLDETSIESIKTYPCIFASRNHLSFGKTDENHYCYFGFIDEILPLDKTIKIKYHMITPIKQNDLIKIMSDLKIKQTSMRNEFDETHWTIKNVDLLGILDNIKINYLPFKKIKEEENINE